MTCSCISVGVVKGPNNKYQKRVNKNKEEKRELWEETNKAWTNLTLALRQQETTNQALQPMLTAQGPLPKPSITPKLDPSVLKMAGEYDEDWLNLLWDQQAAKS